jgi:hypothetical protein
MLAEARKLASREWYLTQGGELAVDEIGVVTVARDRVRGGARGVAVAHERAYALAMVRRIEEHALTEQGAKPNDAGLQRTCGFAMPNSRCAVQRELCLPLDDRTLHGLELGCRVALQPDSVPSEERISVRNESLELPTKPSHIVELLCLHVGLATQVGGTLLAGPTPKPRMCGNARHTKGDAFLDRDVASIDRGRIVSRG